MLKNVTWISIALACACAPAYAASFTCTFSRAGESQNECQLDTANEQQQYCQYEYATETPRVLGFCYALPQEEGGGAARQRTAGAGGQEKALLGCGFATTEAAAKARASGRQRAQAANRRPRARVLEEGFFALGDTIGVHDDLLVGVARGASELDVFCLKK